MSEAVHGERDDDGRESPRSDDDLRALLRQVRQVEIRARRSVNAHAQGAYHSRFKGRGMAFEESRAYTPGDDPRHVDWNVTARTGELYVKQFIEERELTVLIAVDVSGSMRTGSRGQEKVRLAAVASALFALAALRNNDKVGLLLFADDVVRMVRPRKGRGHVLRILREILAVRPRGETRLGPALEKLTHLSERRAVVVVITDLLEARATAAAPTKTPLGDTERALRVLQKKHDLLLVELTDPLERVLPNVGLLALVDPETGTRTVIDTSKQSSRTLFATRVASERAAIHDRLKRLGVERVAISVDEDPTLALVRFLRRRTRRAA